MTSQLVTVVRRSLVVVLPAVALAAVAAPAGADTPEGWPEPPGVDMVEALLVFGVLPVAIALLLLALVYVPALVRGERVSPGAPEVENQWLGGPRREPHELAAPDSEDSAAGGASARW